MSACLLTYVVRYVRINCLLYGIRELHYSNDIMRRSTRNKRKHESSIKLLNNAKSTQVVEKKVKSPLLENDSDTSSLKTGSEKTNSEIRDKNGCLVFDDVKDFRPNRSPKEIFQAGSFGGTYFRSIKSGVTGEIYKDAWKEFPCDWFENLDIETQVASQTYRKAVNKYKVKCGASLVEWESSGWIKPQDPYGWFQWYCRFFLGRRTSDDQRQISRWKNFDGRFKNNLINQIRKRNTTYNDVTVSPAIRQSLLHWGIELTENDVIVEQRKTISSDTEKRLIDLVPLT